MSILIRFSPANMTSQEYDETVRRLEESGGFPPEGLEYHVCFGTDGNLRVSEIWSSQEQLDAFGKRLMPILAEVGIEPGQVFFDVDDEDGSVDHVVAERLTDLAFPAAADSARLVAERAFAARSD